MSFVCFNLKQLIEVDNSMPKINVGLAVGGNFKIKHF